MSSDKPLLRILQRLPSAVIICNPVTGKILWVNERLSEMYGVADPHAVLGKSIFDFIEPPQQSQALTDLGKVMTGCSPAPFTYQLKRANGEPAAGQVSSVPMVFQGQPAVLSFIADVSEQERIVRDLTESEERYRLLLETMPSGVVVIVDENIVYANVALARVLGFDSPGLLIGHPMYRYIHEDYRDPVREARKNMMLTQQPHHASLVLLVRRDGTPVATTASSSVVHWDGQPASQTLMHNLGGAPAGDDDGRMTSSPTR